MRESSLFRGILGHRRTSITPSAGGDTEGAWQRRQIRFPDRPVMSGKRTAPTSPHPNPPPQAGEGVHRARPLLNPPPRAGEGRVGAKRERVGERVVNEAMLYGPVKRFLEGCGYEVKGEVHGCDLVARRGDEPAVIVELKLRFTLALVLQGIDRLRLSERVYLAVPRPSRGTRGVMPDAPPIRRLCRRLGVGLILVGRNSVAIVEEPVPYRPRPAAKRAARLIAEFDRRIGDMNVGGRNRAPVVTAYRQDALRVAGVLAAGPMRVAELRTVTGVADAASILQRDVYGWFARLRRGTYALSDRGHAALGQFAEAVAVLADLGANLTDRAVA